MTTGWESEWSPGVVPPSGIVHIWGIDLDVTDDRLESLDALLDSDERTRKARFRSALLKNRFVAAHGALREIVGCYLGMDPATVMFQRTTRGKPHVTGAPLAFNLAHSAGLAVCAIAAEGCIGVDVEAVRPVHDSDALVCRYFAADEAEAYVRVPASRRERAFLDLWTRKEAIVKAIGEGLGWPLDSFSVCIESDRVAVPAPEGGVAAFWSIQSLKLRSGYVGALAYDRAISSIVPLSWPASRGLSAAVQSTRWEE